jgi:uncharacterized protein
MSGRSTVPRTAITRLPELGSTERSELDRLLDVSRVGHFALLVEGHPVVMATAIARDGDSVLAHGSTTSLAVTAVEGLVVARSAFESSMHYRSAVLFGRCQPIEAASQKRAALDVITDALIPGRVGEVREPTAKELAATLVLRLPIGEWSLKVSAGWPDDPDDDVAGTAWAGVVPIVTRFGTPRPAPDLRSGIDTAESVRRLAGD